MTDRQRLVTWVRIETQRIWCQTCGRNGVYAFHWHRQHRIGARKAKA